MKAQRMEDIKRSTRRNKELLSPQRRPTIVKTDSTRFIGIEVNVEKEHRFELSPLGELEVNTIGPHRDLIICKELSPLLRKSASKRNAMVKSQGVSFRNIPLTSPSHQEDIGINLNSKEFEKIHTPSKILSPKRDYDTVYHDAHSTNLSSPGYTEVLSPKLLRADEFNAGFPIKILSPSKPAQARDKKLQKGCPSNAADMRDDENLQFPQSGNIQWNATYSTKSASDSDTDDILHTIDESVTKEKSSILEERLYDTDQLSTVIIEKKSKPIWVYLQKLFQNDCNFCIKDETGSIEKLINNKLDSQDYKQNQKNKSSSHRSILDEHTEKTERMTQSDTATANTTENSSQNSSPGLPETSAEDSFHDNKESSSMKVRKDILIKESRSFSSTSSSNALIGSFGNVHELQQYKTSLHKCEIHDAERKKESDPKGNNIGDQKSELPMEGQTQVDKSPSHVFPSGSIQKMKFGSEPVSNSQNEKKSEKRISNDNLHYSTTEDEYSMSTDSDGNWSHFLHKANSKHQKKELDKENAFQPKPLLKSFKSQSCRHIRAPSMCSINTRSTYGSKVGSIASLHRRTNSDFNFTNDLLGNIYGNTGNLSKKKDWINHLQASNKSKTPPRRAPRTPPRPSSKTPPRPAPKTPPRPIPILAKNDSLHNAITTKKANKSAKSVHDAKTVKKANRRASLKRTPTRSNDTLTPKRPLSGKRIFFEEPKVQHQESVRRLPLSPPRPPNFSSLRDHSEKNDLSEYQKGCFLPKCSHFKEWLKSKNLMNKCIFEGWIGFYDGKEKGVFTRLKANKLYRRDDIRYAIVLRSHRSLTMHFFSSPDGAKNTNHNVSIQKINLSSFDIHVNMLFVSKRKGSCLEIRRSHETLCFIMPVNLPQFFFVNETRTRLIGAKAFENAQRSILKKTHASDNIPQGKNQKQGWGDPSYMMRYAPEKQNDSALHLMFTLNGAIKKRYDDVMKPLLAKIRNDVFR